MFAKRTWILTLALLSGTAIAQSDPFTLYYTPYWVESQAETTFSKTLHNDLQMKKFQYKLALYGAKGLLNLTDQLNPEVNLVKPVPGGTTLIVPVPHGMTEDLPPNWAIATSNETVHWRLVRCCDAQLLANLKGLTSRKDVWPKMIANANGQIYKPHLKPSPGQLMLLPEDFLKGSYLPQVNTLPALPQSTLPPTTIPEPSPLIAVQEPEPEPILALPIPQPKPRLESRPKPKFEANPKPKTRAKPKLTRKQKRVIAKPRQAELAEIIDLPPEAIEKIAAKNPEALEEKLTEESMAEMDEASAEKIPEKTKENKAMKVSFLDAMKPGASKLFKTMKKSSAGIYVGTRMGLSLISAEEKLLSQVQVYGLLAEVRAGWLSGLRFYWDYVPTVSAEVDGSKQSMGWNRFLLGYSFEFKMPWQLAAHLAPQLGRYSLNAQLPPASGGPEVATGEVTPAQEFNQANAISGGIYADLERQAFFYILRLWASTDRGIPGASPAGEEAVTARFGFDAFLKGTGFSLFDRTIAPSYLLFTSLDYLTLKGQAEESGAEYNLNFFIPYVGAGVSLSW